MPYSDVVNRGSRYFVLHLGLYFVPRRFGNCDMCVVNSNADLGLRIVLFYPCGNLLLWCVEAHYEVLLLSLESVVGCELL